MRDRLLPSDTLPRRRTGCAHSPHALLRIPAAPLVALALALVAVPACEAQDRSSASQTLPEAPQPQKSGFAAFLSAEPCLVKNTGATMSSTAALRALALSGLDAVPKNAGQTAVETTLCVPHMPMVDWYARFLNGPEVKPLTPEQKGNLAVHNLLDPFNLLTIVGEAGIAVAANSHSSYGPGFHGWGNYVGVSFTQDMTGEFFGTFLIPSLAHQDPHYHRMPNASIKRRIAHAAYQVFWTQGDNGKGMINYADLGGFAIDDAISNLYVPGQRTDFRSSGTRYGIALATAPIDNYVSEFLPDVARHIHVQVVIIQRIINQVARADNTAP
jgi:hypothetical protein